MLIGNYFRTFMMGLGLRRLLTTALFIGVSAARNCSAESEWRQLYIGRFAQAGLVQWEGPMELYLRYDPEAKAPTPLAGIITWREIGNARTAIQGKFLSHTKLEFREVRCVSGDCESKLIGGLFKASLSEDLQTVTGTAQGPLGLTGTFELRRTNEVPE